MTYIPLPDYLKKFNNDIKNFGLIFQKFFPYDNNSWKTDHSIDEILKKYSSHASLIKKKNKQQDDFLTGYHLLSSEILQIRASLASRLVTGIGQVSPAEVGMVFDRNMGIPYIPASSVKGAVRYAYCINYMRESDENDPYIESDNGKTEFLTTEPGFTALFGTPDDKNPSKGGFCFMDAYPATSPVIKSDIMNPHFGQYYQGNSPPLETESPVPIKFLAVEKGLEFNFRGYFIKKGGAEPYKEKLINAFKTALEETGLGAKTAVGYGRFEKIEDLTSIILTKSKKLQEEEKAEKRKAELATMTDDERDLAAFDDNISTEQIIVIFKKIDQYPEEIRLKIAQRLKAYWIKNKQWSKKDVGQKQWKKIRERNQVITDILGEQ